MASSSVPTVKKALLTALKTDSALSDVQIDWGQPGVGDDRIFFGDTTSQQEARSLGGGIREEDYTIEVYVVCHSEGDDPQAIETRCYALCAQIAAVIEGVNGASDLGVTNGTTILSVTAEYGGERVQTFAEADGWTSQAAPANVNVTARIK